MKLSGMTFFILTGDKRETAISIGRSCGLIDQGAQLVDIDEYDKDKDQEWRLKMLRHKESK
jgi:magnesium-transporting ATPase (P-type)